MASLIPIVSYGYTLVEGESVVTSEEWRVDGNYHRVDGPAWRMWKIVEGQPVLIHGAWCIHGRYVDLKDLHQAATTIRRWFIRHRDRREVIISSHLRKAGMIVFPGFMGLLRRF